MSDDKHGSNRLPALAAEIRKAHADVQDAAKTAAERAIAAGHLLIEAKALVQHGEWLPWLREHCALAERTAQLYMKIAEKGLPAETVAAIGLQGAANVLQTIVDPYYDPFYHCDEEGKRQWHVFTLFLVRASNWYPEGACCHCEWLLQQQYKTPCEWLGTEGAKHRNQMGMGHPSAAFITSWQDFLAKHESFTVEEAEKALKDLDDKMGPMPAATWRRRRKRKSATVADLPTAAEIAAAARREQQRKAGDDA